MRSRFIEKAIQASFESPCSHKHGAVLVKGHRLLKKSYNTTDFSKIGDRYLNGHWHGTRHAEVSLLHSKDVSGCDIYVVRTKRNRLVNSKPCHMCERAMRASGIRRVYYSNEHGKIVKMNL